MYKITEVGLKNFLSHEDSVFKLNNGRLTLIFGKNHDDKNSGANSNGSGKSSIIEAITLCTTGELYRDVSREDWVRDGEKEGSVYCIYENQILDKKIKVKYNFTNSKNSVFVYSSTIQGEFKIIDSITGIPEAKSFIIDEIGISKEDLLNYFIINQDNSSSFFKSTDSKQKEVISRFSDFSLVENVKIQVEKELSELESESVGKVKEIELLNKQKSELEEELQEEESKNSEATRQKIIDDYLELSKSNRETAEKYDALVKKCKSDKDSLFEQMNKIQIPEEEYAEKLALREGSEELEAACNDKLRKKRRELDKINDEEIYSINKKINKFKNSLEHKTVCPSCKHEWLEDSDLTIQQIEENIKNLELEKVSKVKKCDELHYEIEELKSEIKDLKDIQEDIDSQLEEIVILQKKIKNLKDEIETIDDNERKYFEKYALSIREYKIYKDKALEIKSQPSESSKIKDKISKVLEKIEAVESSFNDLKVNMQDRQEILFHLSKKGFQTFLANKTIKIVENVCNHYLQKMNTNLRVKINGYKKLASGEFREKIEVFIEKDGVIGKFGKFSGGQKERLKIASILTFQGLINSSLPKGKGLDLIVLDETIDSLDDLGQILLIKTLASLDTNVISITHGGADNVLDGICNKVIVDYKNKKSKIRQND